VVIIPYSVSFSESDFPQGAQWSVTFNGKAQNSTSSSITFSAVNGVYPFHITPPAGYSATPSSGNITVSGANMVELITFNQVPEFPSYVVLPLFMMALLLAAFIFLKRKRSIRTRETRQRMP
jgi:hypothetical protein